MKTQRLLSLDIYRGMTIVFMIIVNTPGSWQYVYAPLRHSQWHGCTPTDLVFPSFLFIVGVSMWFSMKKYGRTLNDRSLLKILYRTMVIFAAGFLLQLFPFVGEDLSKVRIMGVLQRIALAYGLGSLLCLILKKQYMLWLATAFILLGYWALLYFAGGSDPYSLEDNAVLKFDLMVLGRDHLYQGFGIPFDPEGLLSTIPSVASVIIGYITGSLISGGKAGIRKALMVLFPGIALIIAGLIWNIWFPVNKPLWTSSYVLYTSGLSMIILGLMYLIIDVLRFKGWTGFFRVFGMNALFIYIVASLWTQVMLLIKMGPAGEKVSLYYWIYNNVCVALVGDPELASLFFAILQVLLMWILVYILYRKKIFIKV
ncbi:MAG: acyltransferase family protein [Bacteroidales bacterium]